MFFPAQASGETKPWTVIKYAGGNKIGDFSSTQDLYDVLCYVPNGMYSQLETYKNNVKAQMKKLEPMIMPTYIETPSYYDDALKAHMVSITYRNSKKI